MKNDESLDKTTRFRGKTYLIREFGESLLLDLEIKVIQICKLIV